jgi:hypothetical protein
MRGRRHCRITIDLRLAADSQVRFGAGLLGAKKGSKNNESSGIGQEDLRQVQGDYSQWGGTRDLRESEAQAASGISQAWQG